MDKQFAYAALSIKAMDAAKRTFTGIATTPTPDRVGDVVEPMGAEFKLPVPLLWMHDAGSPVGWVRQAKVSADGIEVQCELAKMDEPGRLKDRLDEAWQSISLGIVAALSIGFKPLESNRIGETYSYRFVRWLWLELSAVTVPANGDCSIQGIKSADQAIRRAASGARPVIRLDRPPAESGTPSPGVSGQPAARRKGVVYLDR